jgi:hypothetical protein
MKVMVKIARRCACLGILIDEQGNAGIGGSGRDC